MSDPLQMVAGALTERRLSTRDKLLRHNLQQRPPGADTEALAQDLTPSNIQALGQAIDRARDPRVKQQLLEELERIKGLASNLMGPVQRPPMLPGTIQEGAQRAPYEPSQQQPGIYGGQRMNTVPAPRSM